MAKPQAFSVALFFCFLLIASNEMQVAAICSKKSKTWSGMCVNTGNCNRQCRDWEKAEHGACHQDGWGFACFCYFKKC